MRDRNIAVCAAGVGLTIAGVLLLMCAVPCCVWQALLGITLTAAGILLFRRCGAMR